MKIQYGVTVYSKNDVMDCKFVKSARDTLLMSIGIEDDEFDVELYTDMQEVVDTNESAYYTTTDDSISVFDIETKKLLIKIIFEKTLSCIKFAYIDYENFDRFILHGDKIIEIC